MIRLCFVVAVALALAQPGTASAQGGSVADRVTALEAKIASLEAAAVQVPTVSEAARKLSDELAQLKQRIDTLDGQQKSIPDAVAVLDRLDLQTKKLEQEIAALRTEVAGLAQPSDTGGGSGGGVTYDGGFKWATDDGNYELKIGGYAQLRYQASVDEDVGDIEEQTLRMRRARVGFKGVVGSPRLKYKILADFVSAPSLRDYMVDYQIKGKALGLRAGQYKTPFTRTFQESSSKLRFPDRTVATDRFRYDRDVQVGLRGLVAGDRVGYYVGIGNGAGPNKVNDNIDVAVTGRVDVVAVGSGGPEIGVANTRGVDELKLQVSLGGVHDLVSVPDSIGGFDLVTDVDVDGDVDNVRVLSASADALLHVDRLELGLEWIFRMEDWGTILEGQISEGDDLSDAVGTDDSRSYNSISGHATYAVIDDLLVGARVSYAKMPFLGLAGRSSRLPLAPRLVQVDGLVQLYRKAGRLVGLQYSFLNWNGDGTGPVPDAEKSHRVVIETQLKW